MAWRWSGGWSGGGGGGGGGRRRGGRIDKIVYSNDNGWGEDYQEEGVQGPADVPQKVLEGQSKVLEKKSEGGGF